MEQLQAAYASHMSLDVPQKAFGCLQAVRDGWGEDRGVEVQHNVDRAGHTLPLPPTTPG